MAQSSLQNATCHEGVVFKKTIGNYTVHTNGKTIECSISTKLRKTLIYSSDNPNADRRFVKAVKPLDNVDPLAVGDRVHYIEAQDGTGMIVDILPRRSKLTRRSAVPMPTAHPFEQVIVANLDQVVPVFAAAKPTPKWNMLDRYLVSAESLGLPSVICITKLDLLSAEDFSDLHQVVTTYRQIGYKIILTSTVTGEGLDELSQVLQGNISVLVGKSGVGKSSLLNAIEPGLGLRVNEVSQVTGKGKHTTTHMEMFPLADGGAIVDTPGVREFGLWEIEEADLALYFPEMRAAVGNCRFGMGCQHDSEPGCAVREAVTAGKISPQRYQSYLNLREETI
jgi:ribosome biogenesis GTPase / thiamine phosphate phosphatase